MTGGMGGRGEQPWRFDVCTLGQVTAESEDYENGVADLLRSIVPEGCQVALDERVRGRFTNRLRQVDVTVRGPLVGVASGFIAVECKRHARRVDVRLVESFIGLVGDVRADVGLMVSASGFSKSALARIAGERGARLLAVSPDELKAHTPAGTLHWTVEIPPSNLQATMSALRTEGWRAWLDTDGFEPRSGGELIRVARHTGERDPSGEVQSGLRSELEAVLRPSAPGFDMRSSGIVIQGGTPETGWLRVAVDGTPTDVKILAATEAEADVGLLHLAESLGVERSQLDIVRPDSWPAVSLLERMLGAP